MPVRILLNFIVMVMLCSCGESYLPGFSFNLFEGTPAENLADAVEDDDYYAVLAALKSNKNIIDYQEGEFGHSLIFLAVVNGKYDAAKALLEQGANLSLKSYSDSADVITTLSNGYYTSDCDTQMLNLLLKYSPNLYTLSYTERGDSISLLSTAISSGTCLTYISALINAGVDVNYTPDRTADGSPVSVAILGDRLDVAYFLLVEMRAAVPEYCALRPHGDEHVPITITQMLSEQDYSNDPDKMVYKDKIIEYLKSINKK